MQLVSCYVSGKVNCRNEGKCTKQSHRGRKNVAAHKLWRSPNTTQTYKVSSELNTTSVGKTTSFLYHGMENTSYSFMPVLVSDGK